MRSRRMRIVMAVLAVVALASLAYLLALFAAHDGNPDFLAIDRCLDAGGAWDAVTRTCQR